MKTYVLKTATDPQLPELPCAHPAYKISGTHVLRGRIGVNARRGIMVIDCENASSDVGRIAAEIHSEVLNRKYEYVLFDFPENPSSEYSRFCAKVSHELSQRKIAHIVPLSYHAFCENAMLSCEICISGGSMTEYLNELIDKFGRSRICAAVTRTQTDFIMPCPNGVGVPLTDEEFAKLYQNHESYYSPELCANYFSYSDSDKNAHFVMFDDAGSFAEKLRLLRQFDIPICVMPYRDAREILAMLNAQ